MITDGNKCHYLAVSNLSALRSKKSQNHNGDLYCFGCFNSYTTKNILTEHKEICNKHDSCRIEMSKLAEKILKYAHGKKSLKAPFAIYLDLECLLKKEQSCQNNPKKLYTKKKKLSMSLPAGQCLQKVHLCSRKLARLLQRKRLY